MMTALRGRRPRAAGARRCGSPSEALAYQGSGVGCCRAGKRIGVETMLYGLLLPSGNDAAIALAQRARRHRAAASSALMNARARAMGLLCTHFTSPERLRGPRQPLVRRRPRRARPRGAARAAAGADRAPSARPCCRSRSRAGSSTSTTTTRCCGGLPRHDGHQDRLHGRGGPLPGRHRAARRRSGSASCCCTRSTPAARRAAARPGLPAVTTADAGRQRGGRARRRSTGAGDSSPLAAGAARR